MTEPLATTRYKLLVEQLRNEVGGGFGWKAEVARRLGVAPSYVSKIAAGGAGEIGPTALARAQENLSLDGRFFGDASIGDAPNYTDFVVSQTIRDAREGVRMLNEINGDVASDVLEDLVLLLSKAAGAEPIASDVAAIGAAVLDRFPFIQTAQQAASVKTEGEARALVPKLSAHVMSSMHQLGGKLGDD